MNVKEEKDKWIEAQINWYLKGYKEINRERRIKKQRVDSAKYSKTKKGKEVRGKANYRRRSLGCIELNDSFVGSEGHHIDKEFVIHIPKEMHRSVAHNVHTGKGMGKINALAIDFCYGG